MTRRRLLPGLLLSAGLWVLLAPPERLPGAWVIVGSGETRTECEAARAARLDGPFLVCARLG